MYEYRKLTPEQRQELVKQRLALGYPPHSPPHIKQDDTEIHAWVVLPNHYHVLAQVPGFDILSDIFGRIHGFTSHTWNREDASQGRKVWFRYTDRMMRSERHYYTTLNYIHYNPVKHSWTSSPFDWKENSVHGYQEHKVRDWLRDLWNTYPVRDYGHGWDDFMTDGRAKAPATNGT
jgi:putative transposase